MLPGIYFFYFFPFELIFFKIFVSKCLMLIFFSFCFCFCFCFFFLVWDLNDFHCVKKPIKRFMIVGENHGWKLVMLWHVVYVFVLSPYRRTLVWLFESYSFQEVYVFFFFFICIYVRKLNAIEADWLYFIWVGRDCKKFLNMGCLVSIPKVKKLVLL